MLGLYDRGPGDLNLVGSANDVDALARAVLCGVDHVEPQMGRNIGPGTLGQLQFTRAIFHIGEAIDVELEDIPGILDAETITGTEILIDPDLQRFLAHATPLGVI